MISVRVASFFAVFLAAVQPAQGATVLTSPVFYHATLTSCDVVNVSPKKAVTALVELIDNAGEVNGPFQEDLLPLTAASVSGMGTWCRFTIVNGSAKSVRAAAHFRTASEYTLSAPAY